MLLIIDIISMYYGFFSKYFMKEKKSRQLAIFLMEYHMYSIIVVIIKYNCN